MNKIKEQEMQMCQEKVSTCKKQKRKGTKRCEKITVK
jgi:hypothetical protein